VSIQLSDVHFGYSGGSSVLNGLSLSIDQGDFLLVMGQNGAGKSTFLKMLNGILKPHLGTVTIDGLDTRSTPVSTLASHIAVTFQNPGDQIFASTVREEILFGPRTLKRKSPDALADLSMDLCGLKTYAGHHPYDLAPAYRKLVTIASAIATSSPILAFDEPTASLSQPERFILHGVLAELHRQQRTLIVVSHDLEYFVPLMNKLALLHDGRFVHSGIPTEIVDNPELARTAGLRLPIVLRLHRIATLVGKTTVR
jgi:energy-coupling factor transporter ATP-binding protein EcfA2